MTNQDAVDKTLETYDKFADEYSGQYLILKRSGKRVADHFLTHLPGKRVLDIGCGPGRDIKYFTDRGLEVTGIDAVSKFITLAKRVSPKAKVVEMDVRNLQFDNESFDGIWVKNVLIHIPKDDII